MSRRNGVRSGRNFRPGGSRFSRDADALYLVHSGASGWSDIFTGIGRLFWLGWRYRSGLAPVYWMAGAMVFGAWLHAVHPNWWPLPVLAGLIVVTAVLWGRPAAVALRFPLLRRRRIRYYVAALAATLSAWVTVATFIGARAGVMETVAVAAMLALGAPWWSWKDRKRMVRLRRVVEDFGDTAEVAKLPGARITSMDVHPWGWVARVRLRRGQHHGDALASLPVLESAMGSRVGALRAELVPTDASQVVLRHVESDPHAKPIPFAARKGKRAASITEPIELGTWEDGEPCRISLLRSHVIIGGATDSGKSGLMNVILARLAECRDVTVWGVDLKEGMELRPWAKTLHRLATNTAEAEALLADAVAQMHQRAAYLAEQGKRVWEPTPDAPALVVTIDEYAELSPKARKHVDAIARLGRAVAVTLVVATQRPTQNTMGNNAVRSQMTVRLCLRVNEPGDVDLILGSGRHKAGWDTRGFDAPGKFYVVAPGHDTPRRARSYLVTDDEVKALANHHTRPDNATRQPTAGRAPNTNGATPPAVFVARQDGEVIKVKPNPHPTIPNGSDGPTGLVRVPGSQSQPGTSTASGPDMALWEALRAAGPKGVSVAELATATKRSKRWLQYRLRELDQAGKAKSVGKGRWRARTADR